MLFIGLVMMGIFSQRYLPMELYPNADLPVLSVNVSAENELDPAYIENQAAIPVEGAASSLGVGTSSGCVLMSPGMAVPFIMAWFCCALR